MTKWIALPAACVAAAALAVTVEAAPKSHLAQGKDNDDNDEAPFNDARKGIFE
jgi:hypothetical protein